MVSPVDKNGGEIQGFGGNFGGGVIQAAAQGTQITYTSASSFGRRPGLAGGQPVRLDAEATSAWATENVTPPMLSGSYPERPTSGVPYQLFSADLGIGAGQQRPPLPHLGLERSARSKTRRWPGPDAPAGYRNYYLRNSRRRLQALS